jgi:hypothetical protein
MLAYLFVAIAVLLRFMPHAMNFTPVGASLLFFGARGARKQLWVPVALLAASDLLLNRFVYAYPFTWDQLISWVWYAAIILLGTRLRENAGILRLAGASLATSISFFLLSNGFVWGAGDMYPRTLNGLWTCYAAGVPFFRHTVQGDLLFTAVMFGTPVLLEAAARALARNSSAAA